MFTRKHSSLIQLKHYSKWGHLGHDDCKHLDCLVFQIASKWKCLLHGLCCDWPCRWQVIYQSIWQHETFLSSYFRGNFIALGLNQIPQSRTFFYIKNLYLMKKLYSNKYSHFYYVLKLCIIPITLNYFLTSIMQIIYCVWI